MFIADLHIHSKYSRATSRECVPEMLDLWARRKGIQVLGTGDFTHRAWREELREKLIPAEEGLYTLKKEFRQEEAIGRQSDLQPRFMISGEISTIYKKNGRVRKVHNLILLPGLEEAEALSRRLEAVGNLHSDGRPILGLDSRDLLEITLTACPEAIFIPAHIWTPHFSLFGAYSGFDDIRECFEDLTGYIYALETGLSSDPPMNWRLSALARFTLVSNSDAHSPANLGREANIFDCALSYPAMLQSLKNSGAGEPCGGEPFTGKPCGEGAFWGTLEFFPEEGKYHWDGHRTCQVCFKPAETKAAGGVCPVCGGRITMGVLHRVEALADREEGFVPPSAKPFTSLVPLQEVVASSLGCAPAGKKARTKYLELVRELGPELYILREAPLEDLEAAADPCITEGIRRLRCGKVDIQPGYDGEYGKIKLLDQSEIDALAGQFAFFPDSDVSKKKKKTAAASDVPPLAAAVETCPTGNAEKADMWSEEPKSVPYGLNPEQWAAVSSPSPAVSVVAGPGTGKTNTLVCRIAYLVEQCGVDPGQITAVTFTHKAAREMRDRLEKHFGDKRKVKAMAIGTFHSLCLQLLAKGKEAGSVVVIDEYQALAVLEEVIKENRLKISSRDALREISLRKNGAQSPVSSAVYDLYCDRLAQYGVMDYDDLLLEALKNPPPPGSFTHLLIDEFQDINGAQYDLIRFWSKNCRSVFMIGDPDQSIYGFRGSDYRFFEKFKEDFPDLAEFRLTQNYRSTPEILACARAVVSGQGPALIPQRKNGSRVRLLQAPDEFSEALFVAKEINRLVGGIDMLAAHRLPESTGKRGPRKDSGSKDSGSYEKFSGGFGDIAVLYRTNRQAEVLEQCLLQEGIPYRVAGRGKFLQEKPVRKALAFFRFLLNPGDLVSLGACLEAGDSYPAPVRQTILQHYAAGEKSAESLSPSQHRRTLRCRRILLVNPQASVPCWKNTRR